MKIFLTTSLCIIGAILFAQEKGLSPISNIEGTIGQTYAVVVGISDYQDEGIPDLNYAHKDAEAFATFLQSPAGGNLDDDHLKVLINRQATSGEVWSAMMWLMEAAQEGDKVILYFSGHGDVEQIMIGQPGFLLCWDAPSKVYAAGGTVQLGMLQSVISTLSINNKAKVFVITDACRSGKLSGSAISGAQATTANLTQQYANEIKILSCQPEEYSIEVEQWGGGRGAFSYHLLDGLYGMADGNSDGSVDLKEIGRYLEDRVSEEVAPENQNPMTIGSRTEKLTDVFPEMLEQLKEGRKGQLQIFTATDTKGIEEQVLSTADSSVIEMYMAFQKALKEKHFLQPRGACAEHFYSKLSMEPQLERLHSSMRRNYAASLQDDAQQLLNLMLSGGLTNATLKNSRDAYENYPALLEKAATLLGENNYMYPILQARKHFIKAYLIYNEQNPEMKKALFEALKWQPDMPHAYSYLIKTYRNDPDSAQYYFDRTIELAPTWNYPYIQFAQLNYFMGKKDKAEQIMEQGFHIDTSSANMKYYLGTTYGLNGKYDLAEPILLDLISSLPKGICFPCSYTNLGYLYLNTQRYSQAEEQFRKVIQLDSSFINGYTGLGSFYLKTNQFNEAEEVLSRAKQLNPESATVKNDLGWFYVLVGQLKEAEQLFLEMIKVDSLANYALPNLGLVYAKTDRFEEADHLLKRALALGVGFKENISMNYAILYARQKQLDKAFYYLEDAMKNGYQFQNNHVTFDDPELDLLRDQTKRWNTLMQKYFHEQIKDWISSVNCVS